MLETCVEMVFCSKVHNVLEMSMVNMGVDSEQSLEDDFNNIKEVLWERDSNLAWKKVFIVELIFNPCHQKVDVFTCRNL